MILKADCEGPDKNTQTRKLICGFTDHLSTITFILILLCSSFLLGLELNQ